MYGTFVDLGLGGRVGHGRGHEQNFLPMTFIETRQGHG